jgi:hypothetical protein
MMTFIEGHLAADAYIGPNDFSFFQMATDIEEAVAGITAFYRRYHSLRYVRGQLVIRLASPLDDGAVAALEERFRDLLLPGGRIAPSGALDEEREDADEVALPRLAIDFNRRDFGRLRSLIDAINDC